MTEKNVHQQKKEVVKTINFLWHAPQISDSKRTEVLKLLAKAQEELLDAVTSKES
jgi:hypothetical protein